MLSKSLLITGDFPPTVSGISTFFYEIWKHLPVSEVVILAPKVRGSVNFDKTIKFKIYRFSFLTGRSFFHQIKKTIFFLMYTIYIYLKERINILHCGHPVSAGFVGLFMKFIFKIKYFLYVWGGETKKYKNNYFFTKLLQIISKNASLLITDSEYTTDEYKKIGISDNRLIKVPLGVDIEKFNMQINNFELRHKLNVQNKKVLLTVARLVERKGHDTVIKSLPVVLKQFSDVVYLIIGGGPLEKKLKQLVKYSNLDKYVNFLGELPHEKVYKYYNVCDIYVMPNKETKGDEIVEGFGISFVEANACGKPVIAGRSGGISDSVIDGETGIIVEPDNVNELSNAIIKLLGDENYAKKLGMSGRKRVEKKFRWDITAKIIDQLVHNTGK